jgi:hypothetical protein
VATFIAASTERHPTDVAELHGYRLVVAQETEKGRRWDETKIKTMTGGDKMTARFMRCDFFDFVPKFKPRLDNVDEAMRRRLLSIPHGEAEGRMANNPAMGDRRMPRLAPDRAGTAQDRDRGDRGILRRPRPNWPMARGLHRRWRSFRVHPYRPALRVVEDVVRRAQRQGGQRQDVGGRIDGCFTRKKGAKGVRGFRGVVLKGSA